MARIKVGSVLKSKDSSKNAYIKIDNDVVLKKGDFLNLDNKKSRLQGIEISEANGKLSSEVAQKLREQVEKMPDFVLFEITLVTKD